MSAVRRGVRNFPVATKILLVAGTAIAGAVVIGTVGLTGITQMQDTRARELQRAVPYISNLNSAALAAKAAANDERGYLIAGDTSFRDEALGRRTAVDAFLAAARQLARPAEQVTVDRIATAMDAWFTALNAEFAQFTTDRNAAIATALHANRDLRKAYETLIADEISRASSALVAGREFDAAVVRTRIIVSSTFLAVLVVAVALAIVVTRTIVGPLRRVSAVLEAMADGDLSGDADVVQGDEVGRMATALRRATDTLRQMISDLATHSASLGNAATALADTSQKSSASAQAGARQAAAVAESAATMSTNVQVVAAGADEMGVSIREISESATQAAAVANRAVDVTEETTGVMAKLGESSAEIGNVIKVITAIAEQTNLLALNATIEAARAGTAGKGFAVVAAEVKDLAQETAKATEDISQRIGAIQADTGGAVAAIEEITGIIRRISDFQTTIASAVEEQTVTTNEMSRNVAEAAGAGSDVAATIVDVVASVQRTTVGVGEANRAADELATMSRDLKGIVDRFRLR